MDHDDGTLKLMEVLRNRAQGQANIHWVEFSLIIASANILGCIILAGTILTQSLPASTRLLAGFIAASSTLAALLAYYSIQVGSLVVFGPLRLSQLALSFVVAGAQLAMFAWPTSQLRRPDLRFPSQYLGMMRHWLLLLAVFSSSAALANYLALRTRRRLGLGALGELVRYERGQARDRTGASCVAAAAVVMWGLSFFVLPYAIVVVGVLFTAGGMAVALVTQAIVARSLLKVAGLDE